MIEVSKGIPNSIPPAISYIVCATIEHFVCVYIYWIYVSVGSVVYGNNNNGENKIIYQNNFANI